MTVVNSQYSTIEEAWGVSQNKAQPSRKACNLYENRNKPRQKPYRNNNRNDYSNERVLLDDSELSNDDYDKYYGYADLKEYSRNRKSSKSPEHIRNQKKIVINPKRNNYDFDGAASRAICEEEPYIYEEEYNDDEDNYLTQNSKKITNYVDEELDEEDDEIRGMNRKNYVGKPTKATTEIRDDENLVVGKKQVLDLCIYTLSGIMLIVILEQFIQLGMKIKRT